MAGIKRRSIRWCRPIERQLFPYDLLGRSQLGFGVSRCHQRHAHEFEFVAASARSGEAALESRQRVLAQRFPRGEGMGDEPIGDLASDLRHPRLHACREDAWRAEGIGTRVKSGRHQRVAIELAFELELRTGFPRLPDSANRHDQLTHAPRRLRPDRAIAIHDMRSDLRTETEDEATASGDLQIVAKVGQVHRIAGEGDGDGRAQGDPFRSARRHG